MPDTLQMANRGLEPPARSIRADQTPRLVAVGGLDPTGGAGLVRDYLTARALGAEVRLVASALTEQAPGLGVISIEPRDASSLEQSLRGAIELMRDEPHRHGDAQPGNERNRAAISVKIGMIPGRAQVDAVLHALRDFAGPVVVDPVLSSSSGGRLFLDEPSSLWPLLARATLVTPNALEAASLGGRPVASLVEAIEVGRALLARGLHAVLVKGGHLDELAATDVLIVPSSDEVCLGGPRLPVGKVRGTGCALATAIAVELSRGNDLLEAVRQAKGWLTRALGHTQVVAGERHFGL